MDKDFFSSQHKPNPSSANVSDNTDPFAQEIGRRLSQPVLTARLSPVITSTSTTVSPIITTTTTTTTTAFSSSPFQVKLGNLSLKPKSSASEPAEMVASHLDPATLGQVLDTPLSLVLDIRPFASYSRSRVYSAVSLSVPSTLLKRPAFSLDKLGDMLSSSSCRRRFSAWKSASRIVVYDTDSRSVPEGSNMYGLLRKFHMEGFKGELHWLKGGFSAVWRERRFLVDESPPSSEGEENAPNEKGPLLRTNKLPISAFHQSSTTTATQRPFVPTRMSSQPSLLPSSMFHRLAANPFYDNIRQFRELEHGITERIRLRLPPSVLARRNDLPFDWLKDIFDKVDSDEGAESLAMQFYRIESRELRRLVGVMDHHARETPSTEAQFVNNFPFSIKAAMEKGTKNRYNNIWPFEHTRVRLRSHNAKDESDYINASYVQPFCTRRRYIATQGPLPTTYTDFWTLCWEQNIRVIVMLTKQIEGSTEKCGCYWRQSAYGPLRLELISSSGEEEIEVRAQLPNLGFDFGVPTSVPNLEKLFIQRTFLLSHSHYPHIPPRKVTQFQFLAWSDFDVPDDPRGLLGFMHQVDTLRAESDDSTPTLLHCSAGIGRTGGYIMIDAALDAIRYELKLSAPIDGNAVARTLKFATAPTVGEHSTIPLKPVKPKPRKLSRNQMDSSETESSSSQPPDEAGNRSTSPASSVLASNSDSSMGSSLLPSFFPGDLSERFRAESPQNMNALPSDPESEQAKLIGALNKLKHSNTENASSGSSTNLPSNSSWETEGKSTTATSFPLSVESSRSVSPAKGTESPQTRTGFAFDYTEPRPLNGDSSPKLLSSFLDPIHAILEDMREQRMSLCQSLRQYVFVHRAIIEGALAIVDEWKQQHQSLSSDMEVDSQLDSPNSVKRLATPTELPMIDQSGAAKVVKRPSYKRRERSNTSLARVTEAQAR